MFKKTLLATTAALFATSTFAADVDNTNLDIAFQGAHFQGAGNQITMLRVPVTNKDSGETQFFDMSAEFAADKNGNLIFKNISTVKSVAFASANQLVAGHYSDSNGRSWYVDGPSIGATGRSIWTLNMPSRTSTNNSSAYYNVQVMSGEVKGNDIIVNLGAYKQMLKQAGSLNYGVIDDDYLASASQSGTMISLIKYNSSGKPIDNWTLRQTPEPQPED
ncbi:conserved exported hypothetical protein [Vibrio chagasii]|uniref:hypothetical protein n=1 Tax=Vibrio TaxID=662 RepID=UPI0014935C62|nr:MULTISPECIES: hypothetical protein [Vibrio]MCG9562301.1 hypothetical protein [Vibrio chagasii]NOH93163.1 hypothetical protein [Vibrio sp. AIC-3]CAH6845303.1 conserved exported hypothetical protein [Vibrio chagasii]CAH7049371.1 conserved exported hypothetical protein [Vibrio chagasii]CAH7102606.1 conserved exported hypothetical protein [Vibrio chagasii]